jgi:hypothetical protein
MCKHPSLDPRRKSHHSRGLAYDLVDPPARRFAMCRNARLHSPGRVRGKSLRSWLFPDNVHAVHPRRFDSVNQLTLLSGLLPQLTIKERSRRSAKLREFQEINLVRVSMGGPVKQGIAIDHFSWLTVNLPCTVLERKFGKSRREFAGLDDRAGIKLSGKVTALRDQNKTCGPCPDDDRQNARTPRP